jgi:2,3-bisphosphoglycerate-dependent phosphoglycerate mutase
VLSSPYLRSIQTVAPTAAALGVRVELREALREWNSRIGATPAWERNYRNCWEQPARSVDGGESHLALEQRTVDALREVAAQLRGATGVIVASHGTWIARALHGLGCTVGADFWLNMPMPSVFVVQADGDRLQAVPEPLEL